VPPTPTQLVWRGRIETALRFAAPGLDLMLAAGDRLSRAVEREQLDWEPPRPIDVPPPQRAVGPGARAQQG
jgi:hypothetical protein